MTLETLNLYARLRRELERAENLKASLETAAEPGARVFGGQPRAPGYRNKLGAVVPKIMDELPLIDEQIDRLRNETRRLESEIDSFIGAIPDFQTRMIFKLRFLEGFTWTWIAYCIGGGNSASAVKKRCYRYLDARP